MAQMMERRISYLMGYLMVFENEWLWVLLLEVWMDEKKELQ